MRSAEPSPSNAYDLIIVGAGTAGLPAALFTSRRGGRVLVLDSAPVIGGTLHFSTGQMSAAGTRLQQSLGIKDSADAHFDDVMRISEGSANPEIVRLAVDQAGPTVDWLMSIGLEPMAGHPVMGLGHEFYSERRYYWGKDGGRSILAVLTQQLETERKQGRIELLLDSPVTALLTSDSGALEGVRATHDGAEHSYKGRKVLLASGGYSSNPLLWEKLDGYKQHIDAAYPFSQGAGLQLAQSVGGYLRGRSMYLTSFGAVPTDESSPAGIAASFETWPDRRAPWEIYVNVRGERFVREDEPSVNEREHALLPQPDQRYWIVFDEPMLAKAPPGIKDWTRDKIRNAAAKQAVFYSAATLGELARRAGIDARGLEYTVSRYNDDLVNGHDAWGREHLPAQITTAPFYAIRMQGFAITSNVGIAVDARLRVLDVHGNPITGLYAVGEALGHSQTSGKAYVGGMSVTPALSLGRLLGQTLPLGVSTRT
ncbi:MAG: FAD-binding protein [Pseudomonadales bacterium]|nr:FAD-binding protein [Pseudomonadales bacterium]